jgi:hypothetical protein
MSEKMAITSVFNQNIAVLHALAVDDKFYLYKGRGWSINIGLGTFTIEEYDRNFNLLRSYTSTINTYDSYVTAYDPLTDTILIGALVGTNQGALIVFDRNSMTVKSVVNNPYGYTYPVVVDDDYIFIRTYGGSSPRNKLFRTTRDNITDYSRWSLILSSDVGANIGEEFDVLPWENNLVVIGKHGVYGAKIIDENGTVIQDISTPFTFTRQTVEGTSGSIPGANDKYICQAQMIAEGIRVRCFDGTNTIDIATESYLPQTHPTTLYTEYQTFALPVNDKVVVLNGWEESDARVSIYDIPSRTLLEQATLSGVTIHPSYNHTFFKGDLYIGNESSLGSGNALIKITPPNKITITEITVSGGSITVNATGGSQVLVFKRHRGATHGKLIATGSLGSPIYVGSGQFKVVVR